MLKQPGAEGGSRRAAATALGPISAECGQHLGFPEASDSLKAQLFVLFSFLSSLCFITSNPICAGGRSLQKGRAGVGVRGWCGGGRCARRQALLPCEAWTSRACLESDAETARLGLPFVTEQSIMRKVCACVWRGGEGNGGEASCLLETTSSQRGLN